MAYQLGDKVKLSDFSIANYCGIDHLKDQQAEVVNVSVRHVKHEALLDAKEGLQRYVAKYGKKDVYEIITLRIVYANSNAQYVVSQFGIEPI